MNPRKLIMIVAIFLIAFFGMAGGASASDNNILNIDFSTDKTSYDSTDEIISTIKITNLSERFYTENMDIRTSLPDEFEIIDEDIKVENGKIIWDVDHLERGDSTELTFTTKLKQTTDTEESSSSPVVTEKTDKNDGEKNEGANDTKVDSAKGDSTKDELTAPQTGDESSIIKYVVILIASIVAGLFAFILIRKKKLPKYISFILAILMFTPALSVAHAEESNPNVQNITETHELTIGDQTYEFETSVTAEIHDGQVDIPVTGTVYHSNEDLLANKEITFAATIDGELVEEVVETDEEGYFIARLAENVTYEAKANGLEAQIKALDLNEIEVSNQAGKIELGKTLVNGDNRSSLQPSAIYLPDEVTSKITAISSDLSHATIRGQADIKANDFIVVPEWEGFPAGIAFQVTSVKVDNGIVTLNLVQPEIEDIFEEIVGDLEADMTPEHFIPAEGVSIMDDPTASLNYFSPSFVSTAQPDLSLGGKVTLNLNNLYNEDNFSLNGSIDLSGKVTGDIEWRLGLNPVKAFDFNFQGEQRINAEAAISKTKKFGDIPLGEFIVPTQIPGVAVSVPFDLVTSINGKVSVKISTGMRQNIGLAYENGSGMRTYPAENFEPFFNTSDVNGSGSITSGVRMSVLAQVVGLDLFGAAATGSVTGSASTSILGGNGPFQCATIAGTFDGKLNLRSPLFKWESDGSINFSKAFASKKIGDCVSSIEINPSELEIAPGETKSVTVTARTNTEQTPINNDDKLSFEVSDEDSISVQKSANRVDIIASESAQDGETIEVKGIYDESDITDTLTIKIVDNREKGELVGQVVDAVEGDPIHGASIGIYHDDRLVSTVETAQDGTYKSKLSPGTYQIEVSHEGYITDKSQVEITSADSTTYDSQLQLVGNEYGGNGTVSGQITNAVNGNGISGATIDIRKGKNQTSGEIIESLTTDENGYYEIELPGGNYTISLSAEGYIPSQANILAIGGEVKEDQNGTLSPDGLIDENLRIVLTWGQNPRDLDSHLTGPKADGGRFHIYFANKVYNDNVNDVNLDRDDITSYGPETVTVINKMQMGTYTYSIHNYTGRYFSEDNQLDLSNSGAKVQVYRDDTLLQTFNVPVNQAGNSWRVFEIVDGQIIPVNQIETIESWSSADSFAPIN